MKIVICDDSKDDLEQTLPECLDDILREDDIIYIETSRHKNVFYTAGQTYSIYKKMDGLRADTPEFPHQHAVCREAQQLCHGPDHRKGDIRPKVKISESETTVYLV